MKLTPRDFINVGVFSALYFVVIFSTGMIGFVGPAFMFVGWFFGIILGGIVIALYIIRTPKIGALALLNLIVGVLFTLTGHYALILIIGPIVGLIADLFLAADRTKLASRIPLAYGFNNLTMIVPLLPIVINADEYFAEVATYMGEDYTSGMRAILQPWVIAVWAGVVMLLGYLGGLLGVRVSRKHFTRAGLA
ncbi:MAG: MptD family putative ECF transporter S component [Corynebacterium sp.]|nr:MptD family putative ECF transporter S component [Corynebacterium sp.]